MKNLNHITKLSELYRLAIKDQQAILELDNVYPDSEYWIYTEDIEEPEECTTCMAGSVMFNTLDCNYDATPNDFSQRDAELLAVLDDTRTGAYLSLYERIL